MPGGTVTVSPGPATVHLRPASKLSSPEITSKRSSITGWTCGGTPPPGSTHISTISASPSSLGWKPSLCFRTGSSTIFCSTSSS